jgi:hypothetical protein
MENSFGLARVSGGRVFPGRFVVGAQGSLGFWAFVSLRLARTAVLLTLLATSLLAMASSASAAECPNEAIREAQHSQSLPECRAYEMVSPPSKNGADVMRYSARTRAAADGNAVVFLSVTGFGDVHGTGSATEYMGVRDGREGTSGWSTHAITPGPLEPASLIDNGRGMEARYTGEFSDDLQHGFFLTTTPLTATSPNTANVPKLYLFDSLLVPDPKFPQLLSDCPACTAPLSADPESQPGVAGASADSRHVIFESDQSLTLDVPHCEPLPFSEGNQCPLHLYEWADGTLRLAGVLPDGSAAPNSQAGQGAMVFSSTRNANGRYTPNTISRDGSRIFFTVRGSGNPRTGALYMRTGNATTTPSTVQINASERTPPDAAQDAQYWTATPDGSHVYFTSPEQLTNTDGSGLYAYDATKPDSALDNLALLFNGSVAGVIGTSDDGSYVYFVTSPPDPELMVWHDGSVHQIATVNDRDPAFLVSDQGFRLTPKLSRVTPDGRHMLFVSLGSSSMPHTGVGDTCVNINTTACNEVYVYDATANSGAGELTCASCTQPPSAPAHTDANIFFMKGRSFTQKEAHLNHPLSDDGRFVFFSTGERLVPEDTNGAVPDLYEYDTVTHMVHLLSSGAPGSLGSYFMDASRNGHDVFFDTRDRLVGWDVDDNLDLYDARIGGGFPDPVHSLVCATGEACRGAVSEQASFASTASSTLLGVGNLKPLSKRVSMPLSKSQKLKKALKACKSKYGKARRKKCESFARRRFGKSGGSK